MKLEFQTLLSRLLNVNVNFNVQSNELSLEQSESGGERIPRLPAMIIYVLGWWERGNSPARWKPAERDSPRPLLERRELYVYLNIGRGQLINSKLGFGTEPSSSQT